mmetsp:Transcript_41611/g.97732  ORF Transcript_41611/g.97732 Transcript_41611/m.97732 type:complete len:614 (-) Transcript_41611:2309-4150(-)
MKLLSLAWPRAERRAAPKPARAGDVLAAECRKHRRPLGGPTRFAGVQPAQGWARGSLLVLVIECCLDEGLEQRVAAPGCRLELGVELHADEPGVHLARQFDHLGQLLALGDGRNDEAGLLQAVQVVLVGLVAMAVALGDDGAVDVTSQRAVLDVGALRAQAHGAAEVGVGIALLDAAVGVLPFVDQRDDGVGRGGVEFGRVGTFQAGHVAGVLNGRDLHAQADAEVGQFVLTGVLGREDLAFHAAFAEAAGHEDGVVLRQFAHGLGRQRLAVHVLDLHTRMVVDAGVAQRLVERLVRVRQVGVFAAHRDGDLLLGVLDFVDEVVPALQVGALGVELELGADELVQPLLVQHARHLVDGVDVPHRDHAVLGHVREEGDLLAFVVGDAAVGAAQQRVGLDADLAQLLHGVLRGLGLEFAGSGDPGHVGQVHEGRVRRAGAQAHLAHGFQEGQGLDVAHGAADLHDGHVDALGTALDVFLDLVGDVRDHLDGLAEVVAAAFLLQHGLVDLAGGEVVGLLHPRGDKALVVAEVQVGFGTVVGDEDLAVLEGRHRAGVDVDVGVQLDEGDFEAARFEDGSQGGRRDALAQRGHHTAGDEDVFGHVLQQPRTGCCGGKF